MNILIMLPDAADNNAGSETMLDFFEIVASKYEK